MQRWIAAGLVAILIFCGGGWFAIKTYKQNRPQPVWVPLPINPKLPSKQRDDTIKMLKERLSDRELLEQVSRDVGLKRKWNLESEDAAVNEIAKRLFVRAGDAKTKLGRVPALHVGLKGKRKESQVCGEVAVRLMQEVIKILKEEEP